MFKLFFGPVGRAVLRILKDKIHQAEERLSQRRKHANVECEFQIATARATRDLQIEDALQDEVSAIFGE